MTATRPTAPRRGDTIPYVSGKSIDGGTLNLRDCYMRRNLAIIVTGDTPATQRWLQEAAEVRSAAQAEAGEIIAVVSAPAETYGLPTLVDEDGAIMQRLGLAPSDLPALLVIDRFGTLFAANVGPDAEELRPADIPGWLEFVACRCS
jgi:hypothetical protein